MSSTSAFPMFSLMVLVSITVFVGGSSVEPNSFPFKDFFNNDVIVHYAPVGCFQDRYPNRALRNHYDNFRSHIDWSRWPQITKDIVRECAKKAYEKGYTTVFGVQFYGECWSDGDAERRFATYGVSKNCIHGVGESWTNQIYRFTKVAKSAPKKCNVNGKVYNFQDTMLIPNDWSADASDSKCMNCTCSSQGTPQDCKIHYHCDINLEGPKCTSYRNVTGECCPQCGCVNDGKVMPEGSKWVHKVNDWCIKCTCGGNGIASCQSQAVICLPCVGEVVPDPGQCCPKCVPKGTTTQAPETLPPTREPPPLPPFPGRPQRP